MTDMVLKSNARHGIKQSMLGLADAIAGIVLDAMSGSVRPGREFDRGRRWARVGKMKCTGAGADAGARG